jgi:hypothetical protein
VVLVIAVHIRQVKEITAVQVQVMLVQVMALAVAVAQEAQQIQLMD